MIIVHMYILKQHNMYAYTLIYSNMYRVCIYIITRISFKTCVGFYHDKNNVPASVFAHYAELAWCLSAFVLLRFSQWIGRQKG